MTSPGPDRIRFVRIAGAVARRAPAWESAAVDRAVAIAEVKLTAAGRADLLAECAGLALGYGERQPEASCYRQMAELCIAAGADQALIQRWTGIGRQRAATATAIPYTGYLPSELTARVRCRHERHRDSSRDRRGRLRHRCPGRVLGQRQEHE